MPHGAASLHRKPALQNPARLEPGDRHLDAIGAQIIETAARQVIAHCRLRLVEPAAATIQFQECHLPARPSKLQIRPSRRQPRRFNRPAAAGSRSSPAGKWVNRQAGWIVCRIKSTRKAWLANSVGAGGRVPRCRRDLNSESCLCVTCTPIASRDHRARARRHRAQPPAEFAVLEFGELGLERYHPLAQFGDVPFAGALPAACRRQLPYPQTLGICSRSRRDDGVVVRSLTR